MYASPQYINIIGISQKPEAGECYLISSLPQYCQENTNYANKRRDKIFAQEEKNS